MIGDRYRRTVELLLDIAPSLFAEAERRFLLSVKSGEPDWATLGIAGAERLPAPQWKLQNIRKLKKTNPRKYAQQFENLRRKLGL